MRDAVRSPLVGLDEHERRARVRRGLRCGALAFMWPIAGCSRPRSRSIGPLRLGAERVARAGSPGRGGSGPSAVVSVVITLVARLVIGLLLDRVRRSDGRHGLLAPLLVDAALWLLVSPLEQRLARRHISRAAATLVASRPTRRRDHRLVRQDDDEAVRASPDQRHSACRREPGELQQRRGALTRDHRAARARNRGVHRRDGHVRAGRDRVAVRVGQAPRSASIDRDRTGAPRADAARSTPSSRRSPRSSSASRLRCSTSTPTGSQPSPTRTASRASECSPAAPSPSPHRWRGARRRQRPPRGRPLD